MKKRGILIILFLAILLRTAFVFSPYFGLNSYEKELLIGGLPSISCVFAADCGLPFYSGLIKSLSSALRVNANTALIFYGRGVSAVLGVVWIYLLYLVVRQKFSQKNSMLFLLICAITPQFVMMSRFYTPVSLSFPLFIVSFYFLQKWFNNKKTTNLFAWILLFFFSCFSSLHFAITAIFILYIYFFLLTNKTKKIPFLLLVLVSAGWFFFSWHSTLLASNKIAPVISDPGVINAINASRGVQQGVSGSLVAKLLFNKSYFLVYWFSLFVKQYSLDNIFSLVEPSSSSLIFDAGPMLVLFVPFFVYGLLTSFKRTKIKPEKLFVLFLFSGSTTAVLSLSFYQDLFLIPLVLIVFYSSLGAVRLIKTKSRAVVFAFFLLINMIFSYYHIANGFFRSDRLENKQNYQEVMEK